MTYDLRRLRLHGLIERIPHTHRYVVTDFGFKAAMMLTRAYDRVLRPGLAAVHDAIPPEMTHLRKAFERVDAEVTKIYERGKLAA